MKFFIVISVTTALFFSYMFSRTGVGVGGQSFEDPNQHFQKVTFDATLRGSFNISQCVKELINCLELVRPDVICERSYMHDTVCGVMRQTCHDYYGNYDSYNYRFEMYEEYCRKEQDQHWT